MSLVTSRIGPPIEDLPLYDTMEIICSIGKQGHPGQYIMGRPEASRLPHASGTGNVVVQILTHDPEDPNNLRTEQEFKALATQMFSRMLDVTWDHIQRNRAATAAQEAEKAEEEQMNHEHKHIVTDEVAEDEHIDLSKGDLPADADDSILDTDADAGDEAVDELPPDAEEVQMDGEAIPELAKKQDWGDEPKARVGSEGTSSSDEVCTKGDNTANLKQPTTGRTRTMLHVKAGDDLWSPTEDELAKLKKQFEDAAVADVVVATKHNVHVEVMHFFIEDK